MKIKHPIRLFTIFFTTYCNLQCTKNCASFVLISLYFLTHSVQIFDSRSSVQTCSDWELQLLKHLTREFLGLGLNPGLVCHISPILLQLVLWPGYRGESQAWSMKAKIIWRGRNVTVKLDKKTAPDSSVGRASGKNLGGLGFNFCLVHRSSFLPSCYRNILSISYKVSYWIQNQSSPFNDLYPWWSSS